jgi:hypothetical protein
MIRAGSPPLPGIEKGNSDDRTWIPRQAAVEPQTGEIFMRALISALVVAGVVGFSLPAFAQEVTAPNKPKPAGRAIDEGNTVKTDPANLNKPGRAADDSVKTDSSKAVAKPGRAADETKSKSNKKKAKNPQPQPSN